MGKENIKAFLSRFNTRRIGGGGDEDEMYKNVPVQRPPQCNAVGILSRLVIENKAFSSLFLAEILKYGFYMFFVKKWLI